MADTISVSIIITFAAELLFSLALPILALVIWKKKEGTELRPAWIGAAAYFVFGMVLEQLINAAVLGTGSSRRFRVPARPPVALRRVRRVFRPAFWRRPHASSYIERC